MIGSAGLALWFGVASQHPLVFLLGSAWSAEGRIASAKMPLAFPRLRFGTVADTPSDSALFADLQTRLAVSGKPSPNIVLIVLESVGAQQIAPQGKLNQAVTPHLHRMHKAGGVLFDSVYANFPGTLSSNIAINTGGRYPTWTSPATVVGRPWDGPLLARDIAEAGYRTGLFAAADLSYLGLDKFLGQAGYDQLIHFGTLPAEDQQRERLDSWGGRDDLMMQRAIHWALPPERSGKPFFLQFMSNAPHHPYAVPEGFDYPIGEGRRERYMRALAYADQAVGQLVTAIEKAGLRDNTIFVVTGDHGDGFGEHGAHGHRESGFDEAVRGFVLLGFPPDLIHPHQSRRVAMLDYLYPTLMALAGSGGQANDGLLSTTLIPRLHFFHFQIRPGAWGVRDGQWKYLAQPGNNALLFDLVADPGEQHNVSERYPERMAVYDALCANWYVSKDREFLTLQRGGTDMAALDQDKLMEPGLKHLRIGYGLVTSEATFQVVQADAFHPEEPVFIEAVWLGYQEPREVSYVWVAPDGATQRQQLGLGDSLQTRRERARLPMPMQIGRWAMQVFVDGNMVRNQWFQVSSGQQRKLLSDPGLLTKATAAKLQSLMVGEKTATHQVTEKQRFLPVEGFVIRSQCLPGLMDEAFEYELISPKGQRMVFPFTLLAGTIKQDREIMPPIPMWQGIWKVQLNGPEGLLAETRFEIQE